MGIVALTLGGFMVLAGASAVLTGAADIRLIQSDAVPGEGSFRNLVGGLGRALGLCLHAGRIWGCRAIVWGCGWLPQVCGCLRPNACPTWAGRCEACLWPLLLLPWTMGLLTLSFDVESGLVSGWGNDHLVGAVGLWLTQWSRFALGVTGSVLTMAAAYALWAIAHPKVSAGLRAFFAREAHDEELPWDDDDDVDDGYTEDSTTAENDGYDGPLGGDSESENPEWDHYMEPDKMPITGADPEPATPAAAQEDERLPARSVSR